MEQLYGQPIFESEKCQKLSIESFYNKIMILFIKRIYDKIFYDRT